MKTLSLYIHFPLVSAFVAREREGRRCGGEARETEEVGREESGESGRLGGRGKRKGGGREEREREGRN